eukprot:GHRR01026502.1.p1 GENE.GHRR01026502.1~~GHRR01026502.1.p1  ORF type:complete len:111 (-),score=9.79 GHRR01026502.1:92-424(-)
MLQLLLVSFLCVYETPVSFATTWPVPRMTHFVVSRPSTPTGPLAWILLVLMPTSAPSPNLQSEEGHALLAGYGLQLKHAQYLQLVLCRNTLTTPQNPQSHPLYCLGRAYA